MDSSLILQRVKYWYKKFKSNRVTYKDGSFRIPTVMNDPSLMIQMLNKSPFIKHDKAKRSQRINMFFMNTFSYQREPDEGLFISIADFKFSHNMTIENVYDPELPAEYNLLNLFHSHDKDSITEGKKKISLSNSDILKNNTWSLYKPHVFHSMTCFKNSHYNNLTIFFTNQWIIQRYKDNVKYQNSSLEQFFESNCGSIILNDKEYEEAERHFYQRFLAHVENHNVGENDEELMELVDEFFDYYIGRLQEQGYTKAHFELTDKARNCIKSVKEILDYNTDKKFLGVEIISEMVGESPTKIKADFKTVYQQTMYQYFSNKQMEEAYQLLVQGEESVQEVANRFGYANPSKFTQRFKAKFNVLPSELIRTASEL